MAGTIGDSLHDEQAVVGVYARTGASKHTLAWQAALRLLRGESPVAVESSLLARGVYPVDAIMEMAYKMAVGK